MPLPSPEPTTFHGTAYEFNRNKAYAARNFFQPTVPGFNQNQFGASAGAPIVKNKAFIFGNYEGVRQVANQPFSNLIPSAAARAGNMCSKAVASGSNACVPHTIVIDPKVVPYIPLWPDPTKVSYEPCGWIKRQWRHGNLEYVRNE